MSAATSSSHALSPEIREAYRETTSCDLADELITRPPYSDPHHSASVAKIVGGGQRIAKPGAISAPMPKSH
jgi:predicted ATPase with chaperone activity